MPSASNSLQEALRALERGLRGLREESPPDDDALCFWVEQVATRLQTNCDAAASGLWSCVAPVLDARPHLAGRLLRYPLEPLYFLGLSSAEEVFAWLSAWSPGYLLPLSPEGARFLRERLPGLAREITETFAILADEATR